MQPKLSWLPSGTKQLASSQNYSGSDFKDERQFHSVGKHKQLYLIWPLPTVCSLPYPFKSKLPFFLFFHHAKFFPTWSFFFFFLAAPLAWKTIPLDHFIAGFFISFRILITCHYFRKHFFDYQAKRLTLGVWGVLSTNHTFTFLGPSINLSLLPLSKDSLCHYHIFPLWLHTIYDCLVFLINYSKSSTNEP